MLISTQRSGTHFLMHEVRKNRAVHTYDEIFYRYNSKKFSVDQMRSGIEMFFGARSYKPGVIDGRFGWAEKLKSRAYDKPGVPDARGGTIQYFGRADRSLTNRSDAAAATWIVRGRRAPRPRRGYSAGDGARRRRGRDVDSPWETGRGGAANIPWSVVTPQVQPGPHGLLVHVRRDDGTFRRLGDSPHPPRHHPRRRRAGGDDSRRRRGCDVDNL